MRHASKLNGKFYRVEHMFRRRNVRPPKISFCKDEFFGDLGPFSVFFEQWCHGSNELHVFLESFTSFVELQSFFEVRNSILSYRFSYTPCIHKCCGCIICKQDIRHFQTPFGSIAYIRKKSYQRVPPKSCIFKMVWLLNPVREITSFKHFYYCSNLKFTPLSLILQGNFRIHAASSLNLNFKLVFICFLDNQYSQRQSIHY